MLGGRRLPGPRTREAEREEGRGLGGESQERRVPWQERS